MTDLIPIRRELLERLYEAVGRGDGMYTDELRELRAALAAPVQGEAVPVEDRGWPDRDYWCKCSLCLHEFTGHKRQVICRVCSEQQDELATPPQPAEVWELVEALRKIDRHNDNPARFDTEIDRIIRAALAKLEGKK